MGLILGGALLHGTAGAIVSLEHIQSGGGGSEEDVERHGTGADFDGGWGNRASGGNITELDVVHGLDGSGNDTTAESTTASTAKGEATAEGSSTTRGSSVATATTASVSGGTSDEGRNNEELVVLGRKIERLG